MIVSVILQQYEEFHDPLNPIPIFLENFPTFKKVWAQYCEDKSICEIHKNKVIDFFRYLGPPLGNYRLF